ncbi:cytochrome P450 [Flammeovirga yaeyamensis]|uniref:Cytochrome P450 n=1 Tax=Flammeovirga yaeyamensis TaxID=367791 RepID=A0AAX1N888_9BACT|nr:cytochrome P450 [Flammeovirga yaeyamensis]MBB3698869.1 cytochrome P450 [Flammeovirga yaeyamensis]NMF37454.1 cytochrome P450 [Flammeovirga yaeyamensis]QWG03733.1 cytochrome P450 [Flammeovirga yaeyamensis]
MNYSKTFKDLDGPKGKPFVGNVLDLEKERLHLQYEDWSRIYGKMYNLKFLSTNVTVCTDPDINAYILKNRPIKFRRLKKLADVINEVGVEGVFTAEADSWRKQRKVTQKALDKRHIKTFFPKILLVASRLENYWNEQLKTKKSHEDLPKDFIRATVDVTTNLAFGYDMNTVENLENITQKHVEKIFPKMNQRVNSPIPFYKYFKSKSDKEFDESMSYLREMLGEIIKITKEKLNDQPELIEQPTNFLEAMIASQEKDNPFTWDEIFGNLYTMLLAGEDTTSNTLTWTSYFLSKHPDVQNKIREEIALTLPNGEMNDIDQLKNLRYVNAVMKEVARLKPVTPNLYMQANEDIVINDILFPKGHFFITQLSFASRSEEFFEDALEFKPERWLTEPSVNKVCPFSGHMKPDAAKPFGGGPRLCPGKYLAEVEFAVFLVTLMKNFELDFAQSEDKVEEEFAFTMVPKNLHIVIKKIKNATNLTSQKLDNINTNYNYS